VPDLNLRELAALVPIAVLCVFLGVYPQPVLDTSKRDLQLVSYLVERAKGPSATAGNSAPAVAEHTQGEKSQ
jgi:NADH:ubiquinone oxidoreductase subunit 4 (subunit M)